MRKKLPIRAKPIGKPAGETKFALSGDNTKVTFVGTKPNGKHLGGFKMLTGSATVTGTDATTLKISASIDTDSLFADDAKLTGHLKSPDFFDVKNNPKATFASTKVEKSGGTYTVTLVAGGAGSGDPAPALAGLTMEVGLIERLGPTCLVTLQRDGWTVTVRLERGTVPPEGVAIEVSSLLRRRVVIHLALSEEAPRATYRKFVQ